MSNILTSIAGFLYLISITAGAMTQYGKLALAGMGIATIALFSGLFVKK